MSIVLAFSLYLPETIPGLIKKVNPEQARLTGNCLVAYYST